MQAESNADVGLNLLQRRASQAQFLKRWKWIIAAYIVILQLDLGKTGAPARKRADRDINRVLTKTGVMRFTGDSPGIENCAERGHFLPATGNNFRR